MSRQLRVGLVVDGTDYFVKPIEAELRRQHQAERFAPHFVRLPLIGQRVNEGLLDRQLQSFIRRHDVTFFEWAASLLVRASHLPKKGRIVARLHSVELATAVEQIDWSRVDHLIVLNQTILAQLQDLVKQSLPAVTIVANGVDLNRYSPQSHTFHYRLGMVCILLPIERIYEVIVCVYQLRQEGHPFTLHIAGAPGEGDARRYAWALQSLVRRLGLGEVVTFHDYVENVANLLQEIDIFISNSYWEGQQLALIEAMASGCYCLSHCWEGVEEMLPAANIFTTDSDFRRKLLAYADLSNAEKQREQDRMRAIAEDKFDERRMVREIIEVIEAVAAR